MTGGAAERFDATLASSPAHLAGPELLPSRLARACALALAVDGAGLSLHVGVLRTPIGASDPQTAHAERLQFTVGDGPCLRAQDTGSLIAFSMEDIARNWPQLWGSLLEESPYRGVLSVPLPSPMGPLVVLDLYVRDPRTLTALDRDDVQQVARGTAEELSLTVTGPEFPDDGSNWLDGPDARRRANVWQAMGLVGIAFGLDAADAIVTMRASAISSARVVDDVAEDILAGRLVPADLKAAPAAEDSGG
ncbi:hypothetical protein SAMN06893096_104439 [Geodermatophilus pulveris]|uniref:ANTAR domain-containing protein n=1 Tax=Geodermatophilus pulveris TaxID=1564159 RepID=A0A239F3E2_9ACTN|nr:hypothetical protein [Geodermatophilus pulveris]SNS51221.1 hypothetical protein SAMN06893096_104439 [Geodermatophilus pulveris]